MCTTPSTVLSAELWCELPGSHEASAYMATVANIERSAAIGVQKHCSAAMPGNDGMSQTNVWIQICLGLCVCLSVRVQVCLGQASAYTYYVSLCTGAFAAQEQS